MNSGIRYPRTLFLLMTCCLALAGCKPTESPTDTSVRQQESPPQQESTTLARETGRSSWSADTPVGKIVADRPETARILELVGIDYCCGGQTKLGVAAQKQGVDLPLLLSALAVVGPDASTTDDQRDWQTAPLGDLMQHIVDRHHQWLRRQLPPLMATTRMVVEVHGSAHPELDEVEETLKVIERDVLPHLDEEESRLFPALRRLANGNPPDDIRTQLDAMRTDHDDLGKQLHRLRELTNGFAVPEDACVKYREMLTGLSELERDMLRHVHLENNLLMPRAMAMLSSQ